MNIVGSHTFRFLMQEYVVRQKSAKHASGSRKLIMENILILRGRGFYLNRKAVGSTLFHIQ